MNMTYNLSAFLDNMSKYKQVGQLTDAEIISTYCSHFNGLMYKFPIYMVVIALLIIFVYYYCKGKENYTLFEWCFMAGMFAMISMAVVMIVITATQQPDTLLGRWVLR